jgi:tRNA pseudouridine38-40 synthase
MVRNLVGAAVAVGEGRFEKEWAQAILDNKERVSDSYVFPANGLTLVKVSY